MRDGEMVATECYSEALYHTAGSFVERGWIELDGFVDERNQRRRHCHYHDGRGEEV